MLNVFGRFALAAAILTVSSPASLGQTKPTAPAAPVASPPVVTPSSSATMNPAAKEVVDKSLAAYAALGSYADTMVHRYDFRGSIGGKLETQSTTQTPRLKFVKPDKFSITGIPLEMVTNGQTLWLVSGELQEYVMRPLSPGQRFADAAGEFADMLAAHPVLEILTGSARSATGFPGLDQLVGVSDTTHGGRACKLVLGRQIEPETGVTIHTRAWFDARTSLMVKLEIDLRESYLKAYSEAPPNQSLTLDQALVTIDFTEIAINETIPSSAFEFSAPASYRKVDQFTPPIEDIQNPAELVGRPAPEFTAQLLGGGEMSLAELKGKVVVLDFWATWCLPCIRMLPSVNTLAQTYKDQPVVILGVNSNVAQDMSKVTKFVSERKVGDMRHALDPGGLVGRQYAAQAIPLTVFIDRDGIVRAVHSAFEADVAGVYGKKIDKLLKGEPLDP